MRLLLVTLALSAVGTPAAAQRPDPTRPEITRPEPQPETPPTPEDETRRARVIARIGDVRITIGDVEDQIGRQSPFMRARYRDPVQLRQLVDNMIRYELLAREADRRGLGTDPEVREATAQSAVQQLIRQRFDAQITPEGIPMADVQAYYDAHPEEFSRPEVRRASHILVATRDDASALLPELRAADARRFRQIAQERSLDAESRARGGDLRYFDAEGHSPNAADPVVQAELVRATFALGEVGDVSEPVEVAGQWSIVKLTGRRPAEHRSVEQAAPSIRLRLWRERRQGAIDAYVAQLRERAHVEVEYDRMRPIRMEPPERMSDEDEESASDESDEAPPEDPAAPPGEAPAHGATEAEPEEE
jgi:peptidyl-prolyl cis-trans isomerase C